jgi:siroheme synthase-like protein
MAQTPKAPLGPDPDYPVVLHLAGRPCLVVGAGPVAAGKARGLVAADARVTVVAPELGPEMASLVEELGADRPEAAPGSVAAAGAAAYERRPYRTGEVAGYDLAVTATGVAEVDARVVAEGAAAGVLVNSADRAVPGSVTLPAVHREGAVTIAVSTGGASPALARWLRHRVTEDLPPGLAALADLLAEERARRPGRPSGRPVDWDDLIEQVLLPLVAEGRMAEARARLLGDDGAQS